LIQFKLRTLDIASNRISKLENIEHLNFLEEFWVWTSLMNNYVQIVLIHSLYFYQANSNLLPTETFADLETQLKDKPRLETVYLEGNPMQKENRATYRNKIRLALPQIKQIDAT
jgi:protein phosphatase 1 regulatory subunit 7